jgi:hypothetical protein
LAIEDTENLPCFEPVHGKMILMMLKEAGITLDSEFANISYSMWFFAWEYLQLDQPVYQHRVSYGCDVGFFY